MSGPQDDIPKYEYTMTIEWKTPPCLDPFTVPHSHATHAPETSAKLAALDVPRQLASVNAGGPDDHIQQPSALSLEFTKNSQISHAQLGMVHSQTNCGSGEMKLNLRCIAQTKAQTADWLRELLERHIKGKGSVRIFSKPYSKARVPALQAKITFTTPDDCFEFVCRASSNKSLLLMDVLCTRGGGAPATIARGRPHMNVQPIALSSTSQEENVVVCTPTITGTAFAECALDARVVAIWVASMQAGYIAELRRQGAKPCWTTAAGNPVLQMMELADADFVNNREQVGLIMQKAISAYTLQATKQVTITLTNTQGDQTTMVLDFVVVEPIGLDFATCLHVENIALADADHLVGITYNLHKAMLSTHAQRQSQYDGKVQDPGDGRKPGFSPTITCGTTNHSLSSLFADLDAGMVDETLAARRREQIPLAFYTATGRSLHALPPSVLQRLFTPAGFLIIRWADLYTQTWAIQAFGTGLTYLTYKLAGATCKWNPTVGSSRLLGLRNTPAGDVARVVLGLLVQKAWAAVKDLDASHPALLLLLNKLFTGPTSPLLLPELPPEPLTIQSPAKPAMGDDRVFARAAEVEDTGETMDELLDKLFPDPGPGEQLGQQQGQQDQQQRAAQSGGKRIYGGGPAARQEKQIKRSLQKEMNAAAGSKGPGEDQQTSMDS